MAPDIGAQLSRFRLEHEIGRSSIARVFRVQEQPSAQIWALKLFDRDLSRHIGFQQKVRDLSHEPILVQLPGLVQLGHAEVIGDQVMLPMEYMAGGSLVSVLKQAPVSRRELVARLRLLAQAVETLAALHSQGIVHGNITPGNLLLSTPFGTPGAAVKLGDLGLALFATVESNRLVGNPIYFGPERFQTVVGITSDIYSCGIILYEIITGTPPFHGANINAIQQKHIHEPPPPLMLFQSGLPARLEELVMRCLAKEPTVRYASGAELLNELQQVIAELDPTPPTLSPAPLPPTIRISSAAPTVHVFDIQRQLLNTYPLQPGETIVGRQSRSAIVLPAKDTVISREHLVIFWDGQQVNITDRSANGTFRRDGSRLMMGITEAWPWHEELRIGEFVLVVQPPTSADPLVTLVETAQVPTAIISPQVVVPQATILPREGWLRRLMRNLLNK